MKILENEQVHVFAREHWMSLLTIFSLYLVGVSLSLVLLWLGNGFLEKNVIVGLSFCFVAFLVLLVSHHWIFIYFLSHCLSGWAITDQRIIEFKFLPYVRHDMEYLSIHEVGEIEKHQQGLLKNFLHYGEVDINIASSQQTVKYFFVPYPGRFVDLVSRLKEK